MVTTTRIRALGGSLAVTLPIELVRQQELHEDEVIEIIVKKQRKNYFGALKGIGKFTEKDRARGQLD